MGTIFIQNIRKFKNRKYIDNSNKDEKVNMNIKKLG